MGKRIEEIICHITLQDVVHNVQKKLSSSWRCVRIYIMTRRGRMTRTTDVQHKSVQ